MNRLPRNFGITVRQWREAHGWSQESLAEKADLNRSYVGEIERGKAIASLLTLEKLARALGTTPSNLLAHCEQVRALQGGPSRPLLPIAC